MKSSLYVGSFMICAILVKYRFKIMNLLLLFLGVLCIVYCVCVLCSGAGHGTGTEKIKKYNVNNSLPIGM